MTSPQRLFTSFALLAATALPLSAQFQSYSSGENANNNATTSGTLTLSISEGTATENGEISGSGRVEKTGAGSLRLNYPNSYIDGTYIQEGTLIASNALSLGTGEVFLRGGNFTIEGGITFTRNITIENGGTLAGAGSGTVNYFQGYISSSASDNVTITAAGSARLHIEGGFSGSFSNLIFAGSNDGQFGNLDSRVLFAPTGYVSVTGNVVVDSGGALQLITDLGGAAVTNNGVMILGTSDGESGTRELGSLSGSGSVRVLVNPIGDGGLRTVTLKVGGLETSTTFSGSLQRDISNGSENGHLALEKVGPGSLELTGSNTYHGGTVVRNGSLLANNSSGSATGSGGVTVKNGATLGGAGFIAGVTQIESGGTLAPGNSPGTLTFDGGLSLDTGSILNFELGTSSDLIRVAGGTLTGSASAGGITLNLANSGGFTAATYTLFNFSGATTSSFDVSDFTFGTTISGYTYSLGIVGSTLQLTASAIPEPSTYAALAGLGALGLVFWRRRRAR